MCGFITRHKAADVSTISGGETNVRPSTISHLQCLLWELGGETITLYHRESLQTVTRWSCYFYHTVMRAEVCFAKLENFCANRNNLRESVYSSCSLGHWPWMFSLFFSFLSQQTEVFGSVWLYTEVLSSQSNPGQMACVVCCCVTV